MAQLRTTSRGQLTKYVAPFLDNASASMKGGLALTWNKKPVLLKNSDANRKALVKFSDLAKSGKEIEAYTVTLASTDGKDLSIGAFEKPTAGAGGNRGDIAEGIIGAAIAARFVNKNKDITVSDIHKIIKTMKGTGKYRETMYVSENKNPRIKDDVRFYLSLAVVNMDGLVDQSNWDSLKDIFESAAKYANGKTVIAWSKLLYENNQKNFIEVISDGLSGQTTTKVDVKVSVDKQRTDINLSLKAGDVKQFGQVSGIEFDKQILIHDKLFGIDVSSLEKKYNTLISKKKLNEAAYLVYEYVAKQINTKLSNKATKDKLLKKLGSGIEYFATLNEKNVTLVQLNKSQAKIYSFNGVRQAIMPLKLKAEIVDSAGKPKIIIKDAVGGNLLEIRLRAEYKSNGEPYLRNVIEKGELLGKLIAVYA
jgi:hypothetical protein